MLSEGDSAAGGAWGWGRVGKDMALDVGLRDGQDRTQPAGSENS